MLRFPILGAAFLVACLCIPVRAQDARRDGSASILPVASAEVSDSSAICDCPACTAPAGETSSASCETCCHGRLIDWTKYPQTTYPMPRPGIFPVVPTQGPAYFSAWDQLTGRCRLALPKSGYSPIAINPWPFFDADWRFVDSIPPSERTLVEATKRMRLNDCMLFSTGGEFWIRYNHEHNSRLTEVTNDYTLTHVRMFGDLSYSDWLRVYGEYIWADNFGGALPAVPPDVDLGDILDLFVDLKLGEVHGQPVYVRAGRQELLYGSQRLVTPLPWANKRHSFDGVKVFRRGEQWDFDAFWTQYVPPLASEFDTPDENQNFAGSWLTYRPEKGEAIDFYYLLYDNDTTAVQPALVRLPFQTNTLGSRWSGDQCGWLWDFEGAIQLGNQGGNDLLAGMATAGLGRTWKDARMSPTAWIYFDYASGDNDPTAGDAHTFIPPFPFGHYYFGWLDAVGRQNIQDLNAHLYLYPTPWMMVWLQYHHFWLAESRDALYNAGGVAIRRDSSGASGNDVGDEIDIVVNFHLTRYSDIMVSYSKLYGGGFLQGTSGPNQAVDAESLYLIFQQRW